MKSAIFVTLMLSLAPILSQAALNDQGDVVQDQFTATCKGDTGTLGFVVNLSTQTITFKDVNAFGGAEILENVPFGLQIDTASQSTRINFEYRWYFTAQYELNFSQALSTIAPGQSVQLTLSGDDDDGAFFDAEQFACEISR